MPFMEREDYLEDIHIRILRVTEDLRFIQRELNCAVMEAPGNPELMEALSQLPEMESIEVLKSAIDQMRHFLWFYMQVMTEDSDSGEALRQGIRPAAEPNTKAPQESSGSEQFRIAADIAMLQFLSDPKNRKLN